MVNSHEPLERSQKGAPGLPDAKEKLMVLSEAGLRNRKCCWQRKEERWGGATIPSLSWEALFRPILFSAFFFIVLTPSQMFPYRLYGILSISEQHSYKRHLPVAVTFNLMQGKEPWVSTSGGKSKDDDLFWMDSESNLNIQSYKSSKKAELVRMGFII